MVSYNAQEGLDSGGQVAGMDRMTTEERSVLALERIADELTLLNQSFERFLDRGSALASPEDQVSPHSGEKGVETGSDAELGDRGNEEREGAGPPAENFSVAGHRYTNLQHSILQARRARAAAAAASGKV